MLHIGKYAHTHTHRLYSKWDSKSGPVSFIVRTRSRSHIKNDSWLIACVHRGSCKGMFAEDLIIHHHHQQQGVGTQYAHSVSSFNRRKLLSSPNGIFMSLVWLLSIVKYWEGYKECALHPAFLLPLLLRLVSSFTTCHIFNQAPSFAPGFTRHPPSFPLFLSHSSCLALPPAWLVRRSRSQRTLSSTYQSRSHFHWEPLYALGLVAKKRTEGG